MYFPSMDDWKNYCKVVVVIKEKPMVTENYLYEMLYCNKAFCHGFDLDIW